MTSGDYRGEQAGATETTGVLRAGKGMECSQVRKTLCDVRVSLVRPTPEAGIWHLVFAKWMGERRKAGKNRIPPLGMYKRSKVRIVPPWFPALLRY